MVIVKMPEPVKPSFSRYIGIDYSGAETPDSSLKCLRVRAYSFTIQALKTLFFVARPAGNRIKLKLF
jgi:hypothetical protein